MTKPPVSPPVFHHKTPCGAFAVNGWPNWKAGHIEECEECQRIIAEQDEETDDTRHNDPRHVPYSQQRRR